MRTEKQTKQSHGEQGSVYSYSIGFLFSIILTLAAYNLVVMPQPLFQNFLTPLIIILALLQLIVQLFFFLHLGQEKKPRWNLYFFIATVAIILLIVVGSMWIMQHLNHNMMPQGMDQYLIHDEGVTLTPAP